MTYDPYWLAIVKVYNPYLSLEIRPKVYPLQDHLDQMVKDEYERILHEGLLVPAQAARVDSSQVGQNPGGPTTDSEAAAVAEAEAGIDSAEIKLVWEKGPIEINRVQKFWPTAPCQGQPGGDPSKSTPCSDPHSRLLTMTRSVVYQPPDRGLLRDARYREQDQPPTKVIKDSVRRSTLPSDS